MAMQTESNPPNDRASTVLKRGQLVGEVLALAYLIDKVFATLPDFLGSFSDNTPLS
jgi:hypothetical protein